MYSLNAPAPSAVDTIFERFRESLQAFDVVRTSPTLLVKRFGPRSLADLSTLEGSLDDALSGWGPIEARANEIDAFLDPPDGPAPVVYLAIDSPGLEALHRHLVAEFGVGPEVIEGDQYVPHITLARGGHRTDLRSLTSASIDPIRWTIEELHLRDVTYDQPARQFHLPV